MRRKIKFDDKTFEEIPFSFNEKYGEQFQKSLTKIFEQHKEGLQPLTNYYIAAKKGGRNLTKKIAKDVIQKFFFIFAPDLLQDTVHTIGVNTNEEGFKPRFNQALDLFEKKYFVKFKIKKGIPPALVEEKIIFSTSFSGGFFDMQVENFKSIENSLNLGELGGDLFVSVVKLPFIPYEIHQSLFDKLISIPLSKYSLPISR